MASGSRVMLCAFVMTGALITGVSLSQTSEPEGRVTAIFHDVQLLPEQADARPAAMNDKVDDGTALRTGDDSRSELTFADLTITRLGANTIFSFNKAGRSVRLDSGAILLYARKNSGAAQISTKAVSVGITGTTVIFESRADSYDRLIVLEGAARFSLNNFPDQSTEVRAGQLLNVKAGAKKLPKPGRVDLRRIIKTHPLIKNFPPLPSLDLILAVADGRNLNRPPPAIGGAGSRGGSPPTYVPNPIGTQTGPGPPTNQPGGRVGGPKNPPKPTPTPKKRWPPRKRATPTPTPRQIIR
jgi:FecR protein